MEKLDASQQEAIKKMSSLRLTAKLLEAGFDEAQVQALDRTQMMNAWADFVASGKQGPVAAASPVGYDPQLERQRLEFEMRRYEEEKEERRLREEERKRTEALREEERKRAEELREEERKKAEELKLREIELREKEFEENKRLREREIQVQIERVNASRSLVSRTKGFADALKGTISRMPSDVVHLLTYFKDVERLFAKFEVPDDLKAHLLRPYLNDKAKILVSRMNPEKSNSYAEVKAMLLREFQLSPAVYLDKFNTDTRKPDETCLLYSARLVSILDAYLGSRKIDHSYEKLVDLLVADRIKSTLPDGCLRHILAIESTKEQGWLHSHDLSEAVDLYFANRWKHNDRPRTGAIGVPAANKFTGAGGITSTPANTVTSLKVSGGQSGNVGNQKVTNERSGEGPRKCYLCGSTSHLKFQCPQREKSVAPSTKAKVNTCQVHKGPEIGAMSAPASSEKRSQCIMTADAEVQVCTGSCNVEPCTVKLCTTESCVDESVYLDCRDCKSDAVESVNACDYARLHYLNIKITDHDKSNVKVARALQDSGSEIVVANSSVLSGLDLPRVGKVKLRGIVGLPVTADLVRLNIALLDDQCNDEYISVLCAVCSEANDDLVLTSDAVNSLFYKQTQSVNVTAVSSLSDNDYADNDVNVDDVNTSDGQNDVNLSTSNCPTVLDFDNDANQQDDGNVDNARNAHQSDLNDASDGSFSEAKADVKTMQKEQQEDETLKGWWSLARRGKGGLFVKDGLLYHTEKILGQSFTQLCLPKARRLQVLELAHDTFGGHLGPKRSCERIRFSFTWPTLVSDCKQYCQTCVACQKRARKTYRDRVPISPIPRAEASFSHIFADCLGPIFNQPTEYNYCLVLCDSATRWPAAYPLKSLTAKNVCEAMLQLFMITGIPATISSDNATNFTSKLNREFLKRLGCSPRFNTPGHPQSSGLVERMVGTLKNMINKVAQDHPKQWHKYLGYICWALREVPNESLGVPPWVLAFGHLPRGPLAVLKETWCGEIDLPLDLGKNVVDFMRDLQNKLSVAQNYAKSHGERAQARYAAHYNLRSKDKHFTVGEQVLLLQPDSTASKVYSQWRGPATIKEVRSPYSYLVELDGARYHVHANKLRKFHVRVDEVMYEPLVEEMSCSTAVVDTCAVIYERDSDFGPVQVVEPTSMEPVRPVELPPSERIDPVKLQHLSDAQRTELLTVLDQFADCFSETPGFCDYAEHEIHVSSDFKPKRLQAYKVPERLKPEVERQINELLSLGFIRPSKSPMASPLVCVLKGPDGRDGVRLAVDYRYVNKHTIGDAYPVPDISDIVQRVGGARYISCFDAKGAFWQTRVRSDHQWLTAFVCGDQLYAWVRTPFGMKSSGSTFVRAVQQVLSPIKTFADSYVDDMSVFSDEWPLHLQHIMAFLQRIRESGLTLNLKKCSFAQSEVKFCGQMIGSGKRRADPDKVSAVMSMKAPETKKQLREKLGFFSWFRDYIPDFAEHAKCLTDLTGKRVSSIIPWGKTQQDAFDKLKGLLCKATMDQLHIIDFTKPFHAHVDASDIAVGCTLSQLDDNGIERPIAFASKKLNETQQRWSTIEKESYAAMWTLQKYRQWLFGTEVILYSDHNPITFLTQASPKSAKLMRWALAIQEYNVKFCYKPGKFNTAADCLSRPDPTEDGGPG